MIVVSYSLIRAEFLNWHGFISTSDLFCRYLQENKDKETGALAQSSK